VAIFWGLKQLFFIKIIDIELMNEYYCEQCNYKTSKKSHYTRHLKTNKHKNILASNKDQIVYNCDRCEYVTYRSDNFERHIKFCNEQDSINDVIEIIDRTKKDCEKKINDIETYYRKLLSEKDTMHNEIVKSLIEKQNIITNNNNKTTYKSVKNYIINNVRPETNVNFELDKPLTDNEIKFIEDNEPLDGTYLFIHGRLIKDRNAQNKLLICFDFSRKKFSYFGKENKWIDDFDLKKLKNLVHNKLEDCYFKIHQYQEDVSNELQAEITNKNIKRYNDFRDLFKDNNIKIIKKIIDDVKVSNKFIEN
jgi:hypothetical protein